MRREGDSMTGSLPQLVQPARIESNGLIDSWLVSFNGQVVLTGTTRTVAQAYARRLNETAKREGLTNFEAVAMRMSQ
jgi:hypothetical protein